MPIRCSTLASKETYFPVSFPSLFCVFERFWCGTATPAFVGGTPTKGMCGGSEMFSFLCRRRHPGRRKLLKEGVKKLDSSGEYRIYLFLLSIGFKQEAICPFPNVLRLRWNVSHCVILRKCVAIIAVSNCCLFLASQSRLCLYFQPFLCLFLLAICSFSTLRF